MKHLLKITAAFAVALSLIACGGDDNDPAPTPTPEPMSVYDVAAGSDDFETLTTALDTAGLDTVLDDLSATYTVFAPTDAAFDLLGADAIQALLADTDALTDVLTYHVISGSVVNADAAIAAAGTTVEMTNGDSVGVSLSGDNLLINTSVVTMTNIEADNGIIHVIDAVLMPPADAGDEPTMNIVETASANDMFTTLVAALGAANLVDTLADPDGNFTVFAPTNDAFDALGEANVAALLEDVVNLTAILTKHVIAGAAADLVTAYSLAGDTVETLGGDISLEISLEDRVLRFGGADFVMNDIRTTNGIIHVIDTVIVGDAGLPKPAENIAEVATAAGSFSTLLTALELTGLDMTLTEDGSSFTVFAPTDAAFDALPDGVLDGLLADTDALTDVLLYHVISGSEILADTASAVAKSDMPMVGMANMDMATVSLNADKQLFINASTVSSANVMASNGVIHVVDAVLIPPAEMGMPTMNIVETAEMAGGFETLLTALAAAGLDTALADASATFTVFAPTDAAFEAIGERQLASIIADTDVLTEILSQHVISGVAADSLTAFALNGTQVETLGGTSIDLVAEEGAFFAGGSKIVTYDVYASNGVIHVIDAVIVGDVELPEPRMSVYDLASDSDDFDTLQAAIEAAGLQETLNDLSASYTVFAPTDAAFEALPEGTLDALLADTDMLADVLLYHVLGGQAVAAAAAIELAGDGEILAMANMDNAALSLSGDSLLVNTSTVVQTDVMADNGIIHAIDTVLLPPKDAGEPMMNIVQTAVAADDFDTLAELLTRANLIDTLSDETATFTVFAPTDAAFEAIGDEALAALSDEQLTAVLTQHVIAGAAVDSVTAFSLNGQTADTVSGNDVTIEIVDGVLQIQGAAVTMTDIYTSNGVIHVIDTVITENLM